MAPPPLAPANVPAQQLPQVNTRLVATDGILSFPGRRNADGNGIYGFGFRGVDSGETFALPEELIQRYKGFVQWPSPIVGVDQNVELYLTMTNLGFEFRPDLDDAHTIHWHGFRNPNAIFDGVPEVSISVPPERDFPYFYVTRVEGTYMYHCHFEDTEHVQMGMDGIAYIRALNGRTYDDDGGLTGFDREFALLLNEMDTTPHDNLLNVQEFIWSQYNPNYWLINGRSFPDTIIRDQELIAGTAPADAPDDFWLPPLTPPGGPALPRGFSQPISSLIQVEENETALLRFANLGYQQHNMELLGPRMTVVGHDATFLGSQIYQTSSIYIGPGEARDVLFTAPAFTTTLPVESDGAGNHNVYWLRNRNAQRLTNDGAVDPATGLGGMVTQVRVYPAGTLGPQAGPNQTI